MKILFMVTTFPALSQTFVLNQITGLIDQGCKVDILAMIKGQESKSHPEIVKYRLLENTFYYDQTLKPIPAGKILRFKKFVALFFNNFRKRPAAVLRSLNVFKLGMSAITLKAFYTTISFITKGPYDIVHCHFGPNGLRGVHLRELGALDGKVVTTFHGYDLTSQVQKSGDRLYERVFKCGDLMMPISYKWRDTLIQMGCDKNKIVVHRMGIDAEKLKPNHLDRKGKKYLRVVSVGRFVEKKGFYFSIKAVAGAVAESEKILYDIIGDGELRQDYEKLIQNLDADDYVKIHGWKDSEEVIEYMKDADVLMAPSITSKQGDQEGIPVVIMEAMACGLAVISTKHSGIPELVKNGKSGFLVDEGDIEGLKDCLIYFSQHYEKIDEMGRAGRKIVKDDYDITKLNSELYKTYKWLLRGKIYRKSFANAV